ncbi:MAG: hypothetical protein NTV63_02445 [Candidatus Woesearchaeota archaeon]|nr:hypothetical protein [Candidatus Woesearchaeota archaeon]
MEIKPESSEKLYNDRISCSSKDKKRLISDCQKIYLKHHPEMSGIRLTQGFMLKKIIDYYLFG